MITLIDNGNSIKFTFENCPHYLYNGTIEVPKNSLSIITDESGMVTFKKSASNDIFVSCLYSELGMTKSEIETWYKQHGVKEYVDEGEVDEQIATATQNYFDGAEYDSNSKRINFKHGSTIKGYIDASDFVIDGMVDDVEIENGYLVITFNTDSGKQPISIPLTDIFNPNNYYDKTATDSLLNGKQDTLIAGSGITISGNVISAEGGGKAISGGTNISITTGETADTINCTLNIKNGTGGGSIIFGNMNNISSDQFSVAFGSGTQAKGIASIAEGESTQTTAWYSHSSGRQTLASGRYSNAEGDHTTASTESSHSEGIYTLVSNKGEHSQGWYNVSTKASDTFGNSGNTLFSVGNGTAENARHNAFEIRQNGDIYLTKDGQDVKLQDQLGGGSITIDPSLDSGSTNAVANSAITVAITAVNNSLTAHTADTSIHLDSGDVQTQIDNSISSYSATVDTAIEDIEKTIAASLNELNEVKADVSAVSGKVDTSTFNTYSGNVETALSGKQDTLIAGSGITISGNVISAEGGNNVVTLTQAEYDALVDKDPDVFYIISDAEEIDLNNYYTKSETSGATQISTALSGKQDTLIAGSGIDITNDVISVTGKVDTSAITTSITSSSTDVQVPSAKAVNDKLGGLSLVKLTQAEYDALATKDNSILYIIVN